ncbi:uncharacterized protein BCR38DRAFT_332235, partial [Pseudomassariella vexata]
MSDCGACTEPSSSKTLRPSISTGQIRVRKATGFSSHSDDLVETTDLRRRKSARELFEQHGISRPSGWLSDEEDLSLSGDGNASPRRFCRICHVCSARTWSPTHCASCGHHLCERCLCEVPENSVETHRGFSHHPSRTLELDDARYVRPPISSPEPVHKATVSNQAKGSQEANPFVIADRKATGKAAEPEIT